MRLRQTVKNDRVGISKLESATATRRRKERLIAARSRLTFSQELRLRITTSSADLVAMQGHGFNEPQAIGTIRMEKVRGL